mmetsp:Transcript_8689/g.32039  ORF Transcript_8689/g.32039 Transcript_8689/m.32039 type:complete len:242 (+) Transcript_8689:70-795(+)
MSPAVRRALFLGPPGVGKSTYASRMAALLGVPHISVGDLVRDQIERRTELGEKFEACVNYGKFVDDSLANQLLGERLAQPDASKGWVLDGFPRTVGQAEFLDALHPVTDVVNMTLRDEALVRKLLGRKECTKCNKGFNDAHIDLPAITRATASGELVEIEPAVYLPALLPKKQECLKYLASARADDTEEVIRYRLQMHAKVAATLSDWYRTRPGVNLVDLAITQGIPETTPVLKKLLLGAC